MHEERCSRNGAILRQGPVSPLLTFMAAVCVTAHAWSKVFSAFFASACPSRRRRLLRAFTSFRCGQFRRPGPATLQATQPTEGHRRRVLCRLDLFCHEPSMPCPVKRLKHDFKTHHGPSLPVESASFHLHNSSFCIHNSRSGLFQIPIPRPPLASRLLNSLTH